MLTQFQIDVIDPNTFEVRPLTPATDRTRPTGHPEPDESDNPATRRRKTGRIDRIASSGYWRATVHTPNADPVCVKEAKSRGGCIMAVMQHIGQFR